MQVYGQFSGFSKGVGQTQLLFTCSGTQQIAARFGAMALVWIEKIAEFFEELFDERLKKNDRRKKSARE